MFGTSGIRGPIGDVVTARLALDVGRAIGVDAESVVVGRDARVTGGVLADAVSVGLREFGVDVVRLGVVSTPTLARSVQWLGVDAGVGVTASHNPAPDNGIKLWNPSGQAFTPTQTDRIERLIPTPDVEGGSLTDDLESASWDEFGNERVVDDLSSRHVARLVHSFATVMTSVEKSPTVRNPLESPVEKSSIEPAPKPLSDLSVVVDLGNGTGRVTVDALYELGATVHTLDAQRDGRFPARKSEPNAETLTALRSAVPALDADLGIAHDGDADRMVAVTGDGEYVAGDLLLALFARNAIEMDDARDAVEMDEFDGNSDAHSPSPRVAVPVDTSLVVADTVETAGGDVAYTPVGDVHVADAASQERFVFGGEPSGAWIWPDETLAPDGHYAALHLAMLVVQNGALASLLEPIRAAEYVTRRANVEVENKTEAMNAIERVLRERYDDIDTIDGLRVDTDGGWFLVRPSGTEPLVRVTAEAREEGLAVDLLESALAVVNDETSR